MLNALPYFLYFVVLAPLLLGQQLGSGWTFLTPVALFGAVGALDMLVGRSKAGGLPGTESPAYSFAPMLWLPFQLAMIVWLLLMVSRHEMAVLEIIGMTLSIGTICGAIGIVFAHEFTHRISWLERRIADALMVTVTYHHFCVEHVHGHHRTVGSRDDPATARLNESFYRFFPRATWGGLISAWHIESERMRQRRRGPYGWRNRVLSGLVTQAFMYVAVGFIFGWSAIGVLAGIGLVAIFYLEVINYMEHYGLERRLRDNGRLEPMGPQHSWDDDHRLSSWLLLNLTHHADHHMRPGEPYQCLEMVEGAGKLPFGYATSFLIALIPPIWFRMMNPKVKILNAD